MGRGPKQASTCIGEAQGVSSRWPCRLPVNLPCPYCGHAFPDPAMLTAHLQDWLKTQAMTPWICLRCITAAFLLPAQDIAFAYPVASWSFRRLSSQALTEAPSPPSAPVNHTIVMYGSHDWKILTYLPIFRYPPIGVWQVSRLVYNSPRRRVYASRDKTR